MFFHMVYKSGQIFLPFCHNSRVWQTDGQTDRRTDRRTEFSSLDRVCIPCSAVKTIVEGPIDYGNVQHRQIGAESSEYAAVVRRFC